MNDPTNEQQQPARVIDLSVEVVGSPEEVWEAIATGPGISSWYVPTTVEEHEGGETTSHFGDGPGMHILGRVAAWEPPRRVVFTGETEGLAFEWLVEARDGGTCIVRLVNSGFLEGDEWDAMYDGMTEGWQLFLENLRLHRLHFPGRAGTSMLPSAAWAEPGAAAWSRLLDGLGVVPDLPVGATVHSGATADRPALGGTVLSSGPTRLALLLDTPLPGTAFLAAESPGPASTVSVWCYLYGDDAPSTTERDAPRWAAWLAALAPS